jgi:YfiH family protein
MNGDRNDPFKGFNLSFTPYRSFVASLLGVKLDSLIFPIQRHTDRVSIIMNLDDKTSIEADAIITPLKGVMLGVLVADCAPILVCAPEKCVVAAVHAGWRGTASGILKRTLSLMRKEFNVSPEECIISIGPSIRWCCYEVDLDVLNAIEKETGTCIEYSKERENGKYCLDIATANQIQSTSLGVKNIWIAQECTFCYPERFYSYRYYKGPTGRQGGFIGLS